MSRQILTNGLALKHGVQADSACCRRVTRTQSYSHALAFRSIARESHSYVTLGCFERLLTTCRISGETGRTSRLLSTFVAQTGSSVHRVRGLDSNGSKEFQLGLLEVAQQCLNVQRLAKTDAHRELIPWETSIVAVAEPSHRSPIWHCTTSRSRTAHLALRYSSVLFWRSCRSGHTVKLSRRQLRCLPFGR
jgi:hypothetical protein